MPRLTRVAAAMATVGLAALVASPVSAHAFGQRYDLPIPLNYFLIGAVAAVALSFVVLGMFVQRSAGQINYPRLNLLRVPAVGPILSTGSASPIVRAVSVEIFILLIVAGFIGTDRPIDNISPTFIWIIWWVGMGYVVALLGNVWMAVNPWKITFEWYQRLTRSRNGRESPPFRYPEGLDVWPALVLFFVFAWAENVYTSAFHPMTLSVMVILYSVVMWTGMAAFGKHTWLRHADAFTVLFGLFSRFSPTEVRVTDRSVCRRCDSDCAEESECIDCHQCFEQAGDTNRELNLRPFAVGLALKERVSTATAAFVILVLSSVTFDGFQDTQTWAGWRADMLAVASADVVDTLALAAVPLIFVVVYLGFSWGIRAASGERSGVTMIARRFVFSLVPIALAYNLAHFITLLLIQGQLIIPLASDPFGFGGNLFGTAEYRINLNIISAKTVWFLSLVAIVVGHVLSVYLAHVISLRRAAAGSNALRGQIPMLALMLLYTASSLWIIAQPIVG